MKGLILETATEEALILLTEKKNVTKKRFLSGGKELSNLLAHEVDLLLKEESFRPDFVASGIGPGSYTGLRVAASLAQALSFGWKVPLIGFCNLLSFTPSSDFDGVTAFDAKMGGLYLFFPKKQEVKKISWETVEKELFSFDKIATPHFTSILEKAPFLEKKLKKSALNEALLASWCEEQVEKTQESPFQILYP